MNHEERLAKLSKATPKVEIDFSADLESEPVEDTAGWDPVRKADSFVRNVMNHADGPLLRRWRGDFYFWDEDDGSYSMQTEEEVESALYQALKLTKRSVVGDVRHALIAVPGVLIDKKNLGEWLGASPTTASPLDLAATPGGVLNLLTGELLPASPNYFATTSLGVRYDPKAPEPTRWLAFLKELWPDDPDSIRTLQEWCGYNLTRDTRQQKMLLLVGAKRSGKGTIMRILTSLLGQASVSSPTLAQLGTNFGLQPLIGKTAAIVGDARLGNRADISQVVERLLSVSGQDSQTIDRKHQAAWNGYLSVRFSIVSNELPRFNDASGALASRFLTLQLSRSWIGQENTGLTDELLTELPGILNWAIEGFRTLRARGRFAPPSSSDEAGDELSDLASPVGAWVRERTQRTTERALYVTVEKAYADYRTWCNNNGHVALSNLTFGRDIRAVSGCERVRARELGTERRFWQYAGLRLA